MKKLTKICLIMAMLVASDVCSHTVGQGAARDNDDFGRWLATAKTEAKVYGISQSTITVLDQVRFNPEIITLDRKQPESHKSFAAYSGAVLTSKKIAEGRRYYRENWKILNEIGIKYGVQPQYIVALWGMETSFGHNTGTFNIMDSLATLAYEGRRRDLFKQELFQALTMIDRHDATYETMQGSWAGAMGQTQFMPSSFLKFAVNYHHHGSADIWHNKADIFASIANYLATTGWDSKCPWGMAVKLPQGFDRSLAKITLVKSQIEWQNMGVQTVKGSALPKHSSSLPASIVIPGDGQNAFLVYANYKTLMDWNRSTLFATTVGLFADAIAKEGATR